MLYLSKQLKNNKLERLDFLLALDKFNYFCLAEGYNLDGTDLSI
jgi:hypothetical protein